MSTRTSTVLLVLPFCLLLSGCPKSDNGVPIYPVTGTVTLDGKTLAGATVSFVPMDGLEGGSAITEENGIYNLRSKSGKLGAPAGKYIVKVQKYEGGVPAPPAGPTPNLTYDQQRDQMNNLYPGGQAGMAPESKNVLPKIYASEAPGLSFTVAKQSKNEYPIQLTSK